MNKTQTRDGKGQIDDVLFNMIVDSMSAPVHTEQAEEIHIEDVIHPASIKNYDAARSGIISPVVLSRYNPERPSEELHYLSVIDHYCSLFGAMKKEEVVKAIENKLQKNEPLEEIANFSALEYSNKVSAKEKEKMVNKFLSSVKNLVKDYESKNAEGKARMKEKVPNIQQVADAYKVAKGKIAEIESHTGNLECLILKEVFSDAKKNSKTALKYTSLGIIGMLPDEVSDRVITSLEKRGMLPTDTYSHHRNRRLAFNASYFIENGIPLVAFPALAFASHNPNYFFGMLGVIMTGMFSGTRHDMENGSRDGFPGSPLFTLPYYIGKAAYLGVKGLAYDLPKKGINSIKNYRQEVRRRVIEKYALREKGKDTISNDDYKVKT